MPGDDALSRPPAHLNRQESNQVLLDDRLRVLVQGVKDYAIFMLDPSGRVICWNTGAALIYGYAEDEIIDQHYGVFFTGQEAAAGEPARELAAALRDDRFETEAPRVRRDGSVFVANVVIGAVKKDGTGQHLGYSQITRDVTERRRLEERLRQAQKLEAIGTLSAGVAHDSNNLLTVIIGFSDVLQDMLPPHEPAHGHAHAIGKAGQRAASLTRQLLAFGRKQTQPPKVMDLNARLCDSLCIVERLLGNGVTVMTELAPDLRPVLAYAGQFEQVLLNLAVNARDAMPGGGVLTLRTANAELGPARPDAADAPAPGRYTLFAVTDTGDGMDAATLARIFEPFFTTKPLGKGTGLGLATVRRVVKQAGGHIDVETRVGGGTTFRVYWPSAVGTPDAVAVAAADTEPADGRETLLLVEDEAAVRELGTMLLQTVGYTVLAAASGDDAVAVAGGFDGTIDLLITDIVMPGINGFEAAARLTAVRPGLNVLYMSGYSEEAVARHGLLVAGTPFLQKPFSPAALAVKVREVLDA